MSRRPEEEEEEFDGSDEYEDEYEELDEGELEGLEDGADDEEEPQEGEDEDEEEGEELQEGEEEGEEEEEEEEVAGTSAMQGPAAAAAGAPAKARRNPLAPLLAAPGRLLRHLRVRAKGLRHAAWHAEDATLHAARFALKFALRAARPVLIGLIAHRALRIVDASRHPAVRAAKAPAGQRTDAYYSALLGPNWQALLEADMAEAMAEVEAGLVTDDMRDEKRQLSAILLRRLEVEEWDKERMRHFYYGLYGLGPWYWDMEERLHNPYFISARGWADPIENWVGKNKAYPKDLPAADADEAKLRSIEAATGAKIDRAVAARKMRRLQPGVRDQLLNRPDSAFRGVLATEPR